MSTAIDFIPKEAKIEVDETYISAIVENLAGSDETDSQVRSTIEQYDNRFTSQRDQYTLEDTGLWNQMDWAFRSCINDSTTQAAKSFGANTPEPWDRAKTGTTQFYRQTTQKSANAYAVQTSKKMPFKYEPLIIDEVYSDDKIAEQRAKSMNMLALWTMKDEKFKQKSQSFWTQVNKYGNIPVMVEWLQVKGTKKRLVPEYEDEEDTQRVTGFSIEEYETIVVNRPNTTILPVEAVKADIAIGCLQEQECVIVADRVGMGVIVEGIEMGFYRDDLLDDLNRIHQWDGTSGFENEEEKKDNRGFTSNPTSTETGQYLKREVFVNLPIDTKGVWDMEKNIPKRFRVTLFGNDYASAVVARVERNQEPDDVIPIEMIHCNPDDDNLLYHISNYEVIRTDISTECTLIRQIIDNNALVNKGVLWEVEGEVRGNDRSFGPNKRIIVDTPNSIGQLTVRDVSQPTVGILDYIKDDSNQALGLDKNSVGESFGARTSALEANTISGNSRRPNLVNIEYISDQFLGWVAYRYQSLWDAYGLPDQKVQITDENDDVTIVEVGDISGEYDVVVDVVNDIRENAIQGQRMTQYITTVGGVEQLSAVHNWEKLAKSYAEITLGTSAFIETQNNTDAVANAMLNIKMIMERGEFPVIDPNADLKTHLEIYKNEKTRWSGVDNPNLQLLDNVIEQMENRIKGGGAGAANPAGQLVNESRSAGRDTMEAVSAL